MSLKDLLVIADNDPTYAARLDIALAVAAEHDAHLTGLYVMPPPLAPISELEDAARRVAAVFAERAGRTTVSTDWRVAEGDIVRVASEQARYADLTVLPQGIDLGFASADLARLPQELALGVGRPVLVIPRHGSFPKVGGRVLVAWNGSREATRAVHDALPLLRRAEQVTILSINPDAAAERRLPGAHVSRHITRHGVTVQATPTITGADVAVGDLLLSYVADHDIDLVVMGAYGHTRLREMVLGGATRTLLRHMTVPVLMSH